MRRRPKVRIRLDPPVPLPGQSVRADVTLVSRAETPVKFVKLSLLGRETAVVNPGRYQFNVRNTPVSLAASFEPGALAPGEKTCSVRFDLPAAIPASYRGAYASIVYELGIHVSIPWWPDLRESFDVIVGRSSPTAIEPKPGSFCTHDGGPRGTDLYVEAALDSVTIAAGGVLAGAISISNVAHHRVRAVDVLFHALERPKHPRAGALESQAFRARIHDGSPDDAAPLPFRIRLPLEAVPGFESQAISLHWQLEVRARVAWGSDAVLLVPITVLPRTADTSELSRTPRWVAPVGRERRAKVWAHVAESAGLANDAEQERMLARVGDVDVMVHLEDRGAKGPHMVARLRWPALGLGLLAGPRRWNPFGHGEHFVAEIPLARGHLVVSAREPEQARDLVTDGLRLAFLAATEVDLGEEGATLAARGSAHSVEQLQNFVAGAMSLVRALVDAKNRVPPPAAMRECVAAWEQFAVRVGGRLERGRMFVHDGRYGSERVELGTHWHDDGSFARTTLTVRFEQPLPSPPPDPTRAESLSASLRAHVEALVSPGRRLEFTSDFVRIEFDRIVERPGEIEPQLDRLAQISRNLRGERDQVPFR